MNEYKKDREYAKRTFRETYEKLVTDHTPIHRTGIVYFQVNANKGVFHWILTQRFHNILSQFWDCMVLFHKKLF